MKLLSPLVLLTACVDIESSKTTETGLDTNSTDTDTNPDTDTADTDSDDTNTENPPQAWESSSHPCFGNRTDAMWFDDADNGYVSCGSTTEGKGLYETTDAGQSWSMVTDPYNILEETRISSIQRAQDGHLYVAGTGPNGVRVLYIDGGGTLQEFYSRPESGAQSWQTFHVGTFRKANDGRSVSESLTGSDVIYWAASDLSNYTSGYGWWNNTSVDGSGAQILDLETYDGKFFAVGSTISQPPYFFYEEQNGMGAEFGLQAVKLSPGGLGDFDGEVNDIAIDSQGNMILSGVNQTLGIGTIWYNNGSYDDSGSWNFVDIVTLIPESNDNATRFYGGCREGNLIVAVGDYSQRSSALMIYSEDNGNTWTSFEPEADPLSKCQIVNSKVYITGASGLFAIFDPSLAE